MDKKHIKNIIRNLILNEDNKFEGVDKRTCQMSKSTRWDEATQTCKRWDDHDSEGKDDETTKGGEYLDASFEENIGDLTRRLHKLEEAVKDLKYRQNDRDEFEHMTMTTFEELDKLLQKHKIVLPQDHPNAGNS